MPWELLTCPCRNALVVESQGTASPRDLKKYSKELYSRNSYKSYWKFYLHDRNVHFKHYSNPNSNCKQESPPAWTQEAYRPLCSDYSFCCPILADPPPPPPAGPDPPPAAGPDPPWLDLNPPPGSWTWPPPGSLTWPPQQLDLTPPAGPDSPPATGPDPPPPAGPEPPPGSWTWAPPPPPAGPDPPRLDLTPPPAGLRTDPPPRGQTDWWTDTCQNITFPSYYVRGR